MENKFSQIKSSLIFAKKCNCTANSRLLKSLADIKLFIAKSVAKDISLWRNYDLVKSSYFNQINFMLDNEIVDFLSLFLIDDLKDILCEIIKLSSLTDSVNLAAINAIYILNRANFIFKSLDFRKIKIPGADLSGSVFINTNFEGSNLQGVSFSESKLYFCRFNDCHLEKAIFSSVANLYTQKSSANNVNISKDEKLLLTCSADRKIRIRTLRKNVILPEIGSYKHKVDWAEFSPCGNYIAILSKENGLKLWDIKSKKIISGIICMG